MNQFECFAIVELFGHQVIAGKVSEQVIGGQGFVRVDVPAIDGIDGSRTDAFTKLYGSNAIYCITPTDEETALPAVHGLRKQPLEVWKLNLPRLSAGRDEDDYEED